MSICQIPWHFQVFQTSGHPNKRFVWGNLPEVLWLLTAGQSPNELSDSDWFDGPQGAPLNLTTSTTRALPTWVTHFLSIAVAHQSINHHAPSDSSGEVPTFVSMRQVKTFFSQKINCLWHWQTNRPTNRRMDAWTNGEQTCQEHDASACQSGPVEALLTSRRQAARWNQR